MPKQVFRERYKGFEVDMRITSISRSGVRRKVARLDGVSLESAANIISIYKAFLPKDKRFGKTKKGTK